MEYPQEFSSKMELVQGMFELARAHRAFDEADHPALKKMKEERLRMMEEDWESKKEKEMEKVRQKQKQWHQSPDIDMFGGDDDDDDDDDDNLESESDYDDEFFNHDEL